MSVMITRSRLILGGAALFAAGIAAAWVIMRIWIGGVPQAAGPSGMNPMPPAAGTSGSGAVVVEIPPDLVARAGLIATEVRSVGLAAATRIPATVEPNAYAVVPLITPAGGRVLRVRPELGDTVAAGAAVAVLQSPELAKATSDEAAARSALRAVEIDLERTRKLVAIGAASQRELEEREAEREAAQARVDAARAEVRLLGGSASRGGEMTVRAEAPGVVIERRVNPGVVVERGATLLVTAPLSPVWAIGEIAEADVGRVHVGNGATLHSDAYPGLPIAGRVTYIAPDVRRETRTAQVRIEAQNPGGRLKFGMLVEARIEGAANAGQLAVPSSAIQRVGSKTVVYVVDPASSSRFEERPVEIGAERGGMVEVRSGLRPGERIVTTGSFFVRAEIERQGLRPPDVAAATPPAREEAAARSAAPAWQEGIVPVTVDAEGFKPSRIQVRRDETVILRFTRVSDSCASEVIVPPGTKKTPLPLKEPVDIPFKASRTGEVSFTCGMDMFKGTIVVQ